MRAEIRFFRNVAEPFVPALVGWNLGDPPFLVLDLLAHGIRTPVPGLRDEGAWAAFLTALTAQESVAPVAPWISDEAGTRELHRLYLPAGRASAGAST